MHTSTLSIVLLFAHIATNAQVASVSSASDTATQSGLGYMSVAEALEALKAKPGVQVQITKSDDWTIINEPDHKQWSFTPNTHFAYPAVVRREIKVNAQGGVFIEMTSLCESTKPNCEKLVEDFKYLNKQMRQSIQNRLKPSGTK